MTEVEETESSENENSTDTTLFLQKPFQEHWKKSTTKPGYMCGLFEREGVANSEQQPRRTAGQPLVLSRLVAYLEGAIDCSEHQISAFPLVPCSWNFWGEAVSEFGCVC